MPRNEIINSFHIGELFFRFGISNHRDPAKIMQLPLKTLWISSERGDFKLSIGGLNNKSPYIVQESLNILQSALCWQSRNFNTVANVKEAMQRNMNQIQL